MYTQRFAEQFPRVTVVPDVLYVDEGQVMTSAGSAAGMDLCMHVIRKDYGAEIANRVARRMVIPPHREGGQAQYIPEAISPIHQVSPLTPVLEWASRNLREAVSVRQLARRAAMSERSFCRHFAAQIGSSPARWLTGQRVIVAQRLLETTTLSVDAVAERVGLGTATNLRHHFHAYVKTTPNQYRRTFRGSVLIAERPARSNSGVGDIRPGSTRGGFRDKRPPGHLHPGQAPDTGQQPYALSDPELNSWHS